MIRHDNKKELLIHQNNSFFILPEYGKIYYNGFLPLFSSETVSFFLPLALLLANTRRPFLVAILVLNPCLLTLFLLEG